MSLNDLSGKTLGQYQLQRLLGVGGMGAVYEAYQPSLKRVVALKLLPDSLSRQPGYAARFTREAETAASLEHPHIVPIYDYGTTDGISYVAMRLLSGGSLEERLAQQGALPLLVIARILKDLANALDYAHGRGVIHRDIKPSNVMFDDQNNAFLVDFGIAKLLEATQGLTQTGATMGTPIFMSPEQWKAEDVSPASDQYALGVLSYFLVTGKAPFEATTPFALMHKHINETPPAVHLITENPLHSPVSPIILRSLAKLPEDRYPTIVDFADAFEKAAQREKRATTDSAIIRKTPDVVMVRKPSRLPWVLTGITTLLALGFMVGMIIALTTDDNAGATPDVSALNTANAVITSQAEAFAGFDTTLAAQNNIATESIIDANTTRIAIQNDGTRAAEDFDATLTQIASINAGVAGDTTELQATIEAQATEQADLEATSEARSTEFVSTLDAVGITVTAQIEKIATLNVIVSQTVVPSSRGNDTPADISFTGNVTASTGVYSNSTTTSRVLGLINPGTSFAVTGISEDELWYRIEFTNASGITVEGYTETGSIVLLTGSVDQLPRFGRVGPTATPSPTVQVIRGTVSQQTAIYSSDSISSRGLGLLNVGDEFTATAITPDGQWYEIEYVNTLGPQRGFIQATNVILYGTSTGLPVLDN